VAYLNLGPVHPNVYDGSSSIGRPPGQFAYASALSILAAIQAAIGRSPGCQTSGNFPLQRIPEFVAF
jgi:hypothetical protein